MQTLEIGGRQLLSLVMFTTLARLLDPSAFGLVAMAGVCLAFVALFTEQGLQLNLNNQYTNFLVRNSRVRSAFGATPSFHNIVYENVTFYGTSPTPIPGVVIRTSAR